jgi:integrase
MNREDETMSRKSTPLHGKNGVYQRGKLWFGIIECQRDPQTNRRVRKRTDGCRTRKEAEAARDAALHAKSRGVVIPKKIRLDEFLERWLTDVEPRVAPRTAASYRGIVRGRLIPTFGALRLAQLTPLAVSAALAQWTNGPRGDGRAGTLSPRSIQLALVVLRMALGMAMKWDLVGRNVAELVEGPRLERKETSFVSLDDLDRLFTEAERSAMFAPVVTCVGLGLRRGELLGLQWRDVDFEGGTVSIARVLTRVDGKLTTKEPKTRLSRRTLNAPGFVSDALRSHKSAEYEAHGGSRVAREAWVFANADGGPLDLDAFGKRFRRVAVHAGLGASLHGLRHGFATIHLQAGTDLKTVSESLGHSSIRLTADLYSHVVASVKRDAADRIDERVRGRKKASISPAGLRNG